MPRERTYLRYQVYRSEARKRAGVATAQMRCISGADISEVRFEPIDAEALAVYQSWDDPIFSWEDVVVWKAREPLSLDIAIWFEQELCGLCFANPNNSRQRIRIVRLEGKPGKAHPLKNRIAALALLAIDEFARIIGSQVIEVQEPMPGAIPVFQQLGFTFDVQGRLVLPVESEVS